MYDGLMFGEIYDAISHLWSWRWPEAKGEITAVDVEKPKRRNGSLRLAVAYKFSVNGDGPYTGESFWTPALATKRRVLCSEAQDSRGPSRPRPLQAG